jgi:hypothetical protein
MHPQINVAGIQNILFLPKEKIVSYTVSEGIIDLIQIELKDADAWHEARHIRGTAQWKEEKVTGPQGSFWKQTVKFKVARHFNFRVEDFFDMDEREFFVIVIDNNRTARMMGYINADGEKRGAVFQESDQSGSDPMNSRNEYECQFYIEANHKALPVVWEVPPDVEPPHDTGGDPPLDPVG